MINSICRIIALLAFVSCSLTAQELQMELRMEVMPETVFTRLLRIIGKQKQSFLITTTLINVGVAPLTVLCGPPSIIQLPSKRFSYVHTILPKRSASGTVLAVPSLSDLRLVTLPPGGKIDLAPIQTFPTEGDLSEGKFQVRYYVDPYFQESLGVWVGELRAEWPKGPNKDLKQRPQTKTSRLDS